MDTMSQIKYDEQLHTPYSCKSTDRKKRKGYKSFKQQSPVSVLQILLKDKGIEPKYELVQIEGAIHNPTFLYKASFGDKDAMGSGKSKKEARNAAAKCLIYEITGNSYGKVNHSISKMEKRDSDNLDNTVGRLQELCMAQKWPLPIYETESEAGLPHDRQFTIACTVFEHKEIGQGKNKRDAKRSAANKMWMKLKENSMEQYGFTQDL
ncbi:Interferon-inducible double-stranded RNA-dependent protein kinase activator A like A [Pseudolycoriella hygida]|uniref:Interferon-inducible double-stranded RNA-dependent protein kinase activator A like A n=1 Tax=Pseudolycoriella hygida TaxID=35572 RepID=A0A9Q0NBU2_9DIPT|nr:Interferon-inducible double-stranded RNA-dependent protein kinase activator A like A [Pseudolycoriella hygida]